MRARAAKRSTSAVDELDRRRGRTVFWGGRCFVSLDTNFCCIAPGELVARSRAGRDARTRKLDASRGAVYVRARRHAPRSRSLLGWSALRVVRHELLLCVSLLANRWLNRARGQRRSHTEARRESWRSVCVSAAPRWTSAKSASVCQTISARGAPTPPSCTWSRSTTALGLALARASNHCHHSEPPPRTPPAAGGGMKSRLPSSQPVPAGCRPRAHS